MNTVLIHEQHLNDFIKHVLDNRLDVAFIKATPTEDNPDEYICAGITDDLYEIDITPQSCSFHRAIPF